MNTSELLSIVSAVSSLVILPVISFSLRRFIEQVDQLKVKVEELRVLQAKTEEKLSAISELWKYSRDSR